MGQYVTVLKISGAPPSSAPMGSQSSLSPWTVIWPYPPEVWNVAAQAGSVPVHPGRGGNVWVALAVV
jgi:hypothetical protein